MLALLSPAKSQDFDTPAPITQTTQPTFKTEIKTLVDTCRQLNKAEIAKLMHISPKLAQLNYERFQNFDTAHFDQINAKQSLFSFQGDVYKGLDAASLTEEDIKFAQQSLVMISGLYGLLRPLDLMQPYRLEMKTSLKNPRGKDLYAFWGNTLSQQLNTWLGSHTNKTIINLASNEYWRAINNKILDADIIQIDFKEAKDGSFKTIGIHAKRARGLMARHIIRHQLNSPNALKHFTEAGYVYNTELSKPNHLVFTR